MAAAGSRDADVLRPFVSRLAVDWLRTSADVRYRTVDGTLVFADISGFTRLTERLAAKGRYGAEEMSDHLDLVLSALLDAAAAYDGWLVKWGGDALLLMFDGDDTAARACAAAAQMMDVIGDVGRLDTSVGRVRLRMSVGIHSGTFEFLLLGEHHRELLVTGDAATVCAQLEATAEAGEILLSRQTADRLLPAFRGPVKEPGVLLAGAPSARRTGWTLIEAGDVPLTDVLPPLVVEHVLAGGGSGEHRHVAIAFVEFRGISELTRNRGPAGIVGALEHLVAVTQRACDRYAVSFHESDIGPDGGKFMLVAGAPRAVDDPCEAMLCVAREVTDNPGDLSVRVGVTTGRVFTGAVGPSYRRSYSVKGDVVNLAARIMGKAQPGEVRATPEVVAASRTQFETRELEPFAVKGKKLPVRAFAVGAPLTRARAEPEVPLAGRVAELATVWTAAVRVDEGQGAVIEVVGAAGIGKTRLLAEARQLTKQFGVITLAAEPYRSATAYALARQLVVEALGLGTGSPETLRARLEAWCAAVAPKLAPWLPLLGGVLGVELPETPETEALDEQFRPAFVERTVVDALVAALAGPTMICVDDAQFADDASRGVLRAIAAEAPERPWLLLVARRPSGEDEPLLAEAVHLELGPLADDEARLMLVSDTHHAPMSQHLTTEVLARGDGNPMFLRELVKTVRDGHLPDVLPDSVEDVVAMQIGQLAPVDRDLLRAASVVGMTVEADLLAEVLQSTYDDVSEQLAALPTFLTRDGTAVRFRQAVTRDAAYAGLPFRRRAELHGGVADALIRRGLHAEEHQATLSVHLFTAGRFDNAALVARSAAVHAATAYANVEAETLYERAIAATRKSGDTVDGAMAEMLEELADVRVRLGEFQQADAAYAAACRQRRDDAVALARIVLKTAWNASWHGKFALALRRSRRAQLLLVDVEVPDAARLRMDNTLLAANTHFRLGRLAEARASLLSLLEQADEQQAPYVVAEALGLLDLAEMGLGLPVDGSRADKALRLYEGLGDLHDEAKLLIQIGSGKYFAGHWQDALDLYRRARDLFVRIGDGPNAAIADANIAEILVDQGRPEEAEASLRSALRTWRAARALNDVAFANSLLARVLARQGNYEQAAAVLSEARGHFASQGARTEVVDADAYRAELLLLEGRPAEALAVARETLASAASVSERPAQAPLLHRIAGAALDAMGEHSAAMDAYAEALSIARQRAAAHDVAFTLTAMATHIRNAGGQPDPAWLEEAATLGRSLGLVIDVSGRATPHSAGDPARLSHFPG